MVKTCTNIISLTSIMGFVSLIGLFLLHDGQLRDVQHRAISHFVAKDPAKAVVYPTHKLTVLVDKELKELVAEVIVEAQDGGMLAQTSNGQLYVLQPENVKKSEAISVPMKPMGAEEISRELLEEFKDFKILKTKHYILCYETSDAYAQWVSILYDGLYKSFLNFWKNKDVKLSEPRFPLVAIIFKSRASYLKYAEPKLGRSAESMLGFYEILSNRVVTFDLTQIEGMIPPGKRVNKSELINQVLSQPEAERSVSTIRHEAVHQLAYNMGLQTRMADNPMWVNEGLAIFFESHDLTSSNPGKSIGLVNHHNLAIFRQYMSIRPADSLLKMLSDDQRFRESSTIAISYGESWAFNFFLLKRRSKEYCAYLRFLSEKTPQDDPDPKQRVAEFQRFFKDDLRNLDRDFISFISELN